LDRLTRFVQGIKYQDGTTVYDHFLQSEEQLKARQQARKNSVKKPAGGGDDIMY
jgi:hypothetical protein